MTWQASLSTRPCLGRVLNGSGVFRASGQPPAIGPGKYRSPGHGMPFTLHVGSLHVGFGVEWQLLEPSERSNSRQKHKLYPVRFGSSQASQPIMSRAVRATLRPHTGLIIQDTSERV